MYLEIKLKRDIALGKGTRARGSVLAGVDLKKGESLDNVHAAMASGMYRLDKLPGKWKLAEGVIEKEVLTALSNPHLFDAVDPSAAAAEAKKDQKPAADDWQAIRTDTLKLSEEVKTVLLGEGWDTAGKVFAAGEAKNLEYVLEEAQAASVVLELKRISGL